MCLPFPYDTATDESPVDIKPHIFQKINVSANPTKMVGSPYERHDGEVIVSPEPPLERSTNKQPGHNKKCRDRYKRPANCQNNRASVLRLEAFGVF